MIKSLDTKEAWNGCLMCCVPVQRRREGQKRRPTGRGRNGERRKSPVGLNAQEAVPPTSVPLQATPFKGIGPASAATAASSRWTWHKRGAVKEPSRRKQDTSKGRKIKRETRGASGSASGRRVAELLCSDLTVAVEPAPPKSMLHLMTERQLHRVSPSTCLQECNFFFFFCPFLDYIVSPLLNPEVSTSPFAH